jgi:hypothetical protein
LPFLCRGAVIHRHVAACHREEIEGLRASDSRQRRPLATEACDFRTRGENDDSECSESTHVPGDGEESRLLANDRGVQMRTHLTELYGTMMGGAFVFYNVVSGLTRGKTTTRVAPVCPSRPTLDLLVSLAGTRHRRRESGFPQRRRVAAKAEWRNVQR